MCGPTYEIKFCTCDTVVTTYPRWTLFREDNQCYVVGMFAPPILLETTDLERFTITAIDHALNNGNAFDFEYAPQRGDAFVFEMSAEESYVFIFSEYVDYDEDNEDEEDHIPEKFHWAWAEDGATSHHIESREIFSGKLTFPNGPDMKLGCDSTL